MNKLIRLNATTTIPIETYAIQGNAHIGIKETGKSYGATFIAEQLLDAGIPFIAFDPIGVWRYLKVPGRGKGYKVVVAGGKEPDLPLSPHSAPAIVRAAMEQNIPLVIDLFDVKISKDDWRRIVGDSLKMLLHENRQLRHIFIEEAPEVCPQRIMPSQGYVYAQVEAVARMGGNSSLGYTLIGQRTQEINKAVLELCECIFLYRQKGTNAIKALREWIESNDSEAPDEVMKRIPRLDTAECFVWQARGEPIFVKMPAKNSFHPDRRKPNATKGIAQDVSTFVGQMAGKLEKVIAEAKENDPAELRKKIVAMGKEMGILKSELERKPAPAPIVKSEPEKVPLVSKATIENLDKLCRWIDKPINDLEKTLAEVKGVVLAVQHDLNRWKQEKPPPLFTPQPRTGIPMVTEVRGNTYIAKKPSSLIPDGERGTYAIVSGIHRSILTALAQCPNGLSAKKIAVRVGKAHKGGYFLNALGKLRSDGFIAGDNSHTSITQDGVNALGAYEPLPTGSALLEYWIRTEGGIHGQMLRVLAERYPNPTTAGELAEAIGKEAKGGYFLNAIGKLRSLDLVTGKNDKLVATEDFFA